MTSFQAFFPTLLAHEGGFVDHPSDPGGATNKGITFATFEQHAKSLLRVPPTLANLKTLTDDQAAAIYKKAYWDRIKADDFPSQKLANFAFDFYVNAGSNAAKVLQKVLRSMGQDISVDGGIGPMTLTAIRAVNQDELYRQYKQGRIAYYNGLVAKNADLKVFLKGWLNRVNSFPD